MGVWGPIGEISVPPPENLLLKWRNHGLRLQSVNRVFALTLTLKTPLPRKITVADEKKIFEMAKRGGFTLDIAGRRELQEAIRKGVGGIWLELTPEQYAKLQRGRTG